MDIYERITYLLTEQHKTRKQLSKATHIPYSTLSSLFQRRSEQMSLSTISKIAEYLGVTIDYLVTGDRTHLLKLAESNSPYFDDDKINREILMIFKKLSFKGKTLLLSKAYELEENETLKEKSTD